MRLLRISWALLLGPSLIGVQPADADETLTGIDCSLNPAKHAAGLSHPLKAVDIDSDGVPEQWTNETNPFGNVVACDGGLGPPCTSSYHHHTGDDFLLAGSSDHSQDREVYAVDNGVVVFSTNGQKNPDTSRGGLVLIKHVAPTQTRFEVPAYRKTFGPPGRQEVTLSYDREFTTELVSYYLHLGLPYVKMGDSVARGQVIGRTYTNAEASQNGYSFVPHLHFELWRTCTANDSDGYEPFGGSDFPQALRDQLLVPTDLLKANAADRELVRIVPVQLATPGNVQIVGAGFGDSPGQVWASGELFAGNPTQRWQIDVSSANWVDSEIRLNLFQGPLAAPFFLVSPLFIEVFREDSQREGAFFYPFKDVEPGHWFSGSVIRLWKDGLIVGASGLARFLPDEPIKRSEFLKMLVQAVCPEGSDRCEKGSEAPGYSDVNSVDWFFEPVRAAWNLGWLDQTQAQFRPHDPIARAEAAKLVALAVEAPLRTPVSSPYSDVSTTDWFAPHVIGLTDAGVVNGYSDRKFRPAGFITRAEAARLIDQIRLAFRF